MGKGSPAGVREVCFFHCYWRGSSLKDPVTSLERFGVGNSSSVKGLVAGGYITRVGKNSFRQIWSNTMEKPRLKGFIVVSDTRGINDHIVRRVAMLESSGEILGAD